MQCVDAANHDVEVHSLTTDFITIATMNQYIHCSEYLTLLYHTYCSHHNEIGVIQVNSFLKKTRLK
jgi:hypothetical protein